MTQYIKIEIFNDQVGTIMGLDGMFRKGTQQIFTFQTALMFFVAVTKRATSFANVKIRTRFTSEFVDQKSVATAEVLRQMFANTVKPVYNDHSRDRRKVVAVDSWSLCSGRFVLGTD